MRSHKLAPHVADVRLQVEGDSLEECFRAALEGMANLIKEGGCSINYDLEEQISITSSDRTSLLIDFLSEVLTHSHVRRGVFCLVEFEKLTDKEVVAKIKGSSVDFFDEDVKAVTFHEANVLRNEKGNFATTIVFDI